MDTEGVYCQGLQILILFKTKMVHFVIHLRKKTFFVTLTLTSLKGHHGIRF